MTGYARIRKTFEQGEVVASLKSVNHRGLDLHFHMSSELDPFENALRTVLKRHLLRGHVQIQVRFVSSQDASAARWDHALLESYLGAFREAAARYGLPGAPDLNAALRMPGMFEPAQTEPDPALEQLLVAAVEEAIQALNQFREREGAAIAAEMRTRNRTVQQCAAEMEAIRSRALPNFQARLEERLADLLKGAQLDPQRLAQEVAFLADRSDISEELTRLKVHAAELEQLLANGGEVGKKLDFLLQELQREANTVLSKSSGVGETGLPLTALGLKVKAEIEKIREQALNLE